MELPGAIQAVLALLAGGMIGWYCHHLRARRRAGPLDPQHQKELEIQRAFLDQLFDNSLEAIALLDPHDRVVRVNAAFTKMFGYTGPEAAARPINDLLAPDDLRGEAQALTDKVVRGQQVIKESVRKHKDGSRLHVLLFGSPILMADGQIGIYAIYRDITQHLKTEQALQQAQKLESLGVLAGGIAHDFNNLLVGILGNAEIALQVLPGTEPARQPIEHIQVAGLRAADLARQMLAYSGKGRFVFEHVDLNAVIEEMTHLIQASITKKATIALELAPDLPMIEADATQIRQVVMNLVVNAAEAIDGREGGAITIKTEVRHIDRDLDAMLCAPGVGPGKYVCLEVTDTGGGMTAATQARIFEPFYTTKFTGRGLGLAVVLGIVRGHAGAIKVESSPARGSRFTILFPAVDAPARTSRLRPKSTHAPLTGRGGKILVIDDDDVVRNVTARILDQLGFATLVCGDGHAGVEAFRTHAGTISCVLLDLTMPSPNGEEVFREIRLIKSDAIVVMMSGYDEKDLSRRFAGEGVAGFLQKPYTVQGIHETLRTALG